MTKTNTQIFKRIFPISMLFLVVGYDTIAQERGSKDSVAVVAPQEQPVNILYRKSKPQKYITGAVSSISGKEVSNIPGVNRLNTLGGRLTGLGVLQNDGLTGEENSSVMIRGYHWYNGEPNTNSPFAQTNNNSPLVLINGRIDDISAIEPNDIESISILKDAASTALYGLNASNGLILVTTKRGKAEKIKISYNMLSSFQQPTRLPKYLDSYNYAVLYNEAQKNDNPLATPQYSSTSLEAYRTGSNPFLYPNVNWVEQSLKDNSLQMRNNLNIGGGSEDARFYFSGSYLNDNGIFNVSKNINPYNTNSNVNIFNTRANVDLKLTKNLYLSTDVRAKREKRNAPGAYNLSYDENIFGAIFTTPANAHPVTNADGSLGGNNNYRLNPYGTLNYSGYNNFIVGSVSSASELAYDFNSLVRGLKLKANFGFTTYTEYVLNRSKTFAVYEGGSSGTYTQFGTNTAIVNTNSKYKLQNRLYDHSLTLDYDTEFGDHSLSSFLMYERLQYDLNDIWGATNGLPRLGMNFQGPKASFSYRYKNRYLLDLVAAYQGSEQYPKGDRYGFFPAVSAGWIISDKSSLNNTGNALSFLKLRASYGRTGKQGNEYFSYLSSYALGGASAVFGQTPTGLTTYYQSQVAYPSVTPTWAKALKANVGLDMALFNNKLNASFDYFNENIRDLLIPKLSTGGIYGATINVPEGRVESSGFEAQAGWTDKAGGLQYFVNATVSFAKNKIRNMGEQFRPFSYQYRTGNPADSRFGYVFDRFFTESDAPGTYPDQSSLGAQRPGDLKYKDLNGDNVINENDQTLIGGARMPDTFFGLNLGGSYKAWDISAFFNGTRGGTTYNSGPTNFEFGVINNGIGSVLEHHLARWTPNSGQSASYPRLTLNNLNNFAPSSFWVRDNSFVRLKYVELGYSLPQRFISKIGLTQTRIFINGNNLFLWDEVDIKDPESTDDALSYPIQRSFSLGLNVKF